MIAQWVLIILLLVSQTPLTAFSAHLVATVPLQHQLWIAQLVCTVLETLRTHLRQFLAQLVITARQNLTFL